MMKFLCSIILVVSTFYVNGSSIFPNYRNYLTLDGQIIYPHGSQISIEPHSRLVVELQDLSATGRLWTTIARQMSPAVVFPIIFNITYASNSIVHGHLHVINAKILNSNDELLFVNEKRVEVRLLGAGRTTFIDICVIPARYYDAVGYFKLREWPELVGTKGDNAVNIIKKETGLKHVFVVTDESQVSKDLRYDRVCIYVDKNGNVEHVPRPG